MSTETRAFCRQSPVKSRSISPIPASISITSVFRFPRFRTVNSAAPTSMLARDIVSGFGSEMSIWVCDPRY